MGHDILKRIEERLCALGVTAAAASVSAGLSVDAIRNIRRASKSGEPFGVSTRTIDALSSVLGVSSSWLMSGSNGGGQVQGSRSGVPLFTVDDMEELLRAGADPLRPPEDTRLGHVVPVFGEEDIVAVIMGDRSMNHMLPSGSIIHVDLNERSLVEGGAYLIKPLDSRLRIRRYSDSPPRFGAYSSDPDFDEFLAVAQVTVMGRVRGAAVSFT